MRKIIELFIMSPLCFFNVKYFFFEISKLRGRGERMNLKVSLSKIFKISENEFQLYFVMSTQLWIIFSLL